jgi:hypothetical protein
MGRLSETGHCVLAALRARPLTLPGLLDAVRGLDGRIGHGTLVATVARLELAGRIRRDPDIGDGRSGYRIIERRMESP